MDEIASYLTILTVWLKQEAAQLQEGGVTFRNKWQSESGKTDICGPAESL